MYIHRDAIIPSEMRVQANAKAETASQEISALTISEK